MADEDINPVVLLADPKVNHRVWAACLKWTPVVKKQRVPSHHKHKSHVKPRRLTSLKVTVGSRNSRGKISRLTGTGILTRPERNHYFSLALAFCSWVRNGYGVFRYSDKELLFLASINGQPAVMADLSGNDADVAQKVSLFLAMNEEPPEKWQVVSSLEHPDNWESIITRLSSADLSRCKLTVGNRSKFTLSAVLFLVAAGAGTVFWMTQPEPDVGPTAEEIAARARLQFKKPEPPPELPHPWASQPVISDFLKACADLRKPSPVALEGWKLTGGTCTPETFTLIYERQPGGTIEGFLARSKEIFNVIPDFNLKDGARQVSVTRPLPSLPGRDEAVPAPSEQLMRVFTWFQKKQLTPAINEIAIPEPLPGNDGEPAPVQKWKEYQFSLSTPVNPDEFFPLLQDTGVRLSNIHFELNGGTFSYSSEGHIYASR
ncbi:TPA: type 4b pilus protein PilO2 [Klebsiella pneumoniae]|nr:type 4b pilus protein PilO2 [Klebsiella pneumoniae]